MNNDNLLSLSLYSDKGFRLFTFWEPKEKMPAYIRLCMQTWKKFLPECEVVLLDYSNLEECKKHKTFPSCFYSLETG